MTIEIEAGTSQIQHSMKRSNVHHEQKWTLSQFQLSTIEGDGDKRWVYDEAPQARLPPKEAHSYDRLYCRYCSEVQGHRLYCRPSVNLYRTVRQFTNRQRGNEDY